MAGGRARRGVARMQEAVPRAQLESEILRSPSGFGSDFGETVRVFLSSSRDNAPNSQPLPH